jgi:hypothetical protein
MKKKSKLYHYDRWDLDSGDIEYRILQNGQEIARVRDTTCLFESRENASYTPKEIAHQITLALNNLLQSKRNENKQ